MTPARTWLRALAAAAAIHLVVGAGLYGVLRVLDAPSPAPAKVEPAPSPGLIPYDIDLQNGAAPTTPGPMPSGPVAKRPAAPPAKEAAATKVVVGGEPAPAAGPETTAAAEGPTAPAGSPAGAPSPPQLTGASGPKTGGSPVGNTGVVGPGPDRDRLIAQALARIRAERHYPELARRRGIEGTVHIAFVVGSDGNPRDITTRRGADPLLDDAAREAVLHAAPLPPLGPAELDLEFVLSSEP